MGIVIDNNGVINVAASTPGTYRITYTTAGTCPNSSTQDITINALPTITIANAGGGFCSGSSTTITTTVSAGTIFAWYKDDVLIVGQTGSSLVVTEAGEYKATVTDANGCTSVLSNGLDIEQFDSPSVTISTVPGTTICTGDTATLTANPTGGTGPYTYLWSTGVTTQAISVSPTTTTTYTVTVTDANGCTATASQEITASTAGTTIASINNDNAMSFNGADAYIDTGATPSSLNLPYNTVTDSDFSISFWYYFDTNQNYDPIIQATQHATNGFGVWQSSTNTASLNFWVGHYSSGSLNTSQLTSGTWHHIACVFEGGSTHTQSIYVNGVLNNSVSYTTSRVIHSGENCLIGGQAFQGRYFEGKLDEFAIFNTTLSSCDIKGIYEATTTVSGQPKTANLLDANTTIPAPVYWNRMGDS